MAWDKSGLKEATQRGLAIGRTKQEFDLQLLLEMLLTIERLEQAARKVCAEPVWTGAHAKAVAELSAALNDEEVK